MENPFNEKEIKAALRVQEKRRLTKDWENMLTEEEKDGKMSHTPRRMKVYKWWAIAASILLLVGFFVWQSTENQHQFDNQGDLLAHYEQALNVPSVSGITMNDNNIVVLKEIKINLDQKEFDAILQLIDNQPDTFIQQNNLESVIGYVYFQQQKYTAAIQTLENFITQQQKEQPVDDALLYLGLSYLGNQQKDRALITLEKLKVYPTKKDLAEQLLFEIENL